MAVTSVKGFAIARVYADAMLQLAESQGDVEVLFEELRNFGDCVEHDTDLHEFVSSPIVDVETRCEMLENVFRGKRTDLFVDGLQVMNRKGRLGLISAVAEEYRLQRDALRNRTEVRVQSASPLTEELSSQLKDAMSRRMGRDVHLIEEVDESLIGGLVLRIGDEKLDASVATRLKRLRDSLLDRASREIHGGRQHFDEAIAT